MNKEFFIKRRINDSGRFSIPKIYMDVLGIEKQDKLGIYCNDKTIIIKKIEDMGKNDNLLLLIKVDSSCGLVIPECMRCELGIIGESYLKLRLSNRAIQVTKLVDNKCLVCGSLNNIKTNNGIAICSDCLVGFK